MQDQYGHIVIDNGTGQELTMDYSACPVCSANDIPLRGRPIEDDMTCVVWDDFDGEKVYSMTNSENTGNWEYSEEFPDFWTASERLLALKSSGANVRNVYAQIARYVMKHDIRHTTPKFL